MIKKLLAEGFEDTVFDEGWNWAYQEDPDDIKRIVKKEASKLIKGFTGEDVKIIGYKSDPQVLNVYLVVFEWKSKTTGMCIMDLKSKKFIEEPGSLVEYGLSLENLQKKHSLQKV